MNIRARGENGAVYMYIWYVTAQACLQVYAWRLMFNVHVWRSVWYADDAAHIYMVGVIALVLVTVYVQAGLHPPCAVLQTW